jgi:predicted kinase
MSKRLTIIRGLSGSGKSTYIREHFPRATRADMSPEGYSPVIVSGDHHFEDPYTGVYTFDGSQLGLAHSKSQVELIRRLEAGTAHVIVDNTHTRRWEMAVTQELARVFGYEVEIVDLFDGGRTDEELAERNSHGVPLDKIQVMRARWERV